VEEMIEQAFELMAANPLPGCLCEFGVWEGAGLEQIEFLSRRDLGGNIAIYGFDTFAGMPQTGVVLKDSHAEVWKAGGYVSDIVKVKKRVPAAQLVKGKFGELETLSHYGIDLVRFARLDCDLYESYRDALALLTPHLQLGTLLLFDEGVAPDDPRYHDSIQDSGARAIWEWQESFEHTLRVLNSCGTEFLAEIV
jgi:O-methyltransferase